MGEQQKPKREVPNPAWHGLKSLAASKAAWILLFGCVLSVVTVFVPEWTGREALQEAFNQIAGFLALVFGAAAVGQKVADGLSKGRTSASTRHAEITDRAEEEAAEDRLRALEAAAADDPDDEDTPD